ncbi:unnamed protein product, partial [Ectocarpus sp. 12 AP-2014]
GARYQRQQKACLLGEGDRSVVPVPRLGIPGTFCNEVRLQGSSEDEMITSAAGANTLIIVES